MTRHGQTQQRQDGCPLLRSRTPTCVRSSIEPARTREPAPPIGARKSLQASQRHVRTRLVLDSDPEAPENAPYSAYPTKPASRLDVLSRIGRTGMGASCFIRKHGHYPRRCIEIESQGIVERSPEAYRRRRRACDYTRPSRNIARSNHVRLHAHRRFQTGTGDSRRCFALEQEQAEYVRLRFQTHEQRAYRR